MITSSVWGICDKHFHGILGFFDVWRGKEAIGKYICCLLKIIYLGLNALQGWRVKVCVDWVSVALEEESPWCFLWYINISFSL